MGWASGSELAENLWAIVKKHIPKNKHKVVAEALIQEFENADCDTMHETSLWVAACRPNEWEEEDE